MRILTTTLLLLLCSSCDSETTKSGAATSEAQSVKPSEAPVVAKVEASPVSGNSGSATFQGKSTEGLEIGAVVKLSKYYMMTMRKGRFSVMLTVPKIEKGSYEAKEGGQGVALTLTGASETKRPSIRAMRSATIVIEEDGEIIKGSYEGTVAGAGEEPIALNGTFQFARSLVEE